MAAAGNGADIFWPSSPTASPMPAMAKVGTSAIESRSWATCCDSDVIVPNKDELLSWPSRAGQGDVRRGYRAPRQGQ